MKATAAAVDVLDIRNPSAPRKVGEIDASPYGAGVNSVDVSNGVVAVAVESAERQQPGEVAFFTTAGTLLSTVTVGALPDMLIWTLNGRRARTHRRGDGVRHHRPINTNICAVHRLRSGAPPNADTNYIEATRKHQEQRRFWST